MKKKRNTQPEALLQMRVRRMLLTRAPADLFWIGGAAGIRLTPFMAIKAKAQGVTRKGWPDLTFMVEGECLFIELKADAGKLSSEQVAFRDECVFGRRENWFLCRSVDEVAATVTSWGIALKPEVPDVGAYDDNLSFAEAFE